MTDLGDAFAVLIGGRWISVLSGRQMGELVSFEIGGGQRLVTKAERFEAVKLRGAPPPHIARYQPWSNLLKRQCAISPMVRVAWRVECVATEIVVANNGRFCISRIKIKPSYLCSPMLRSRSSKTQLSCMQSCECICGKSQIIRDSEMCLVTSD